MYSCLFQHVCVFVCLLGCRDMHPCMHTDTHVQIAHKSTQPHFYPRPHCYNWVECWCNVLSVETPQEWLSVTECNFKTAAVFVEGTIGVWDWNENNYAKERTLVFLDKNQQLCKPSHLNLIHHWGIAWWHQSTIKIWRWLKIGSSN